MIRVVRVCLCVCEGEAVGVLFTLGGPSDDIDGLCVLGKGSDVFDFAVLSVCVDLPQLFFSSG